MKKISFEYHLKSYDTVSFKGIAYYEEENGKIIYNEKDNTKVVLDSEDTSSTFAEQNKAFCERINAYQDIKKISEENKQLENASHMLLAANYYLERQSKSLELGGFSDSAFCKRK